MTSLTTGNIRLALHAIRTSKLRSFLTMLGIIISVSSVIVAVSLGEGVRHQVDAHVKQTGSDVITVRPGRLVRRGQDGTIQNINYVGALSVDTLNEQDVTSARKVTGVEFAVPLGFVSGTASISEGRTFADGHIIGTTADLPAAIQKDVQYGSFFGSGAGDHNRNIAIIGKSVAEQLFQENIPIGKIMTIRNREFIVQGVFDTFENTTLTSAADFNSAIFIPYGTAKSLVNGNVHVAQILVKPKAGHDSTTLISDLTKELTMNHGGQEDFTVLKQSELLAVTGSALTIITSFVSSIAAISLLVGGIGIMNIMFVSVTERTREIGIRKSIGATNRQIYGQFLVEAAILSLVGGIVGILVALSSNFLLRVLTDIKPVITLPVILMAMGVSVAVGVIFGTAPAIKAARKDPISALRYE